MKLILTKFIYNNSFYTIISYLLFFILYKFYFIIKIFIKNNNIKGEALATIERVKIILKYRKILEEK